MARDLGGVISKGWGDFWSGKGIGKFYEDFISKPTEDVFAPGQRKARSEGAGLLQEGAQAYRKIKAGDPEKEAQAAIDAQRRNFLKTLRGAGVNQAQAAMAGAGNLTDVYNMAKSQAEQRRTATELAKAQGITGAGSAFFGVPTADMGKNIGGLAQGIGAMGMAFSDKNSKEDIKEEKNIDQILSEIKPISYKYKTEGKNRLGILAQDLEKSPMKENVVDTKEGKAVDTDQQSLANTALIKMLNDKMNKMIKTMGVKNA